MLATSWTDMCSVRYSITHKASSDIAQHQTMGDDELQDNERTAADSTHLLACHITTVAQPPHTSPNRQYSSPDGISIRIDRNSSIARSTLSSSFELQHAACDASQHTATAQTPGLIGTLNQQHFEELRPCPILQSAQQAVSARLLPPLLLLVMVSYIDRTNLSFASIQLSRDLNLSSTIYGLGSGAFFLAYACGQLPSNFLIVKYGAPTWLAAISVVWGATAAAFALVRGPVSFVLLRLLLGLAESGAIPGVWYYVSLFYPADKTTLPYSLIETGITVSQVIAAPFAALLLLLDGVAGLRGWQWLFMVEGLPALLLGCAIRFWLPENIQHANFLTAKQKQALNTAIAKTAATAAAAAADVEPCNQQPSHAADNTADNYVKLHVQQNVYAGVTRSPRHTAQHQGRDLKSHQCKHVTGSPRCAVSLGRDLELHQQQCNVFRAGTPVGEDLSSGHDRTTATAAADDGAGHEKETLLQQSMWRSDGSIQQTSTLAGSSSSSVCCGSSSKRQALLAVLSNKVVLYAGCWRILHDIPGNGILYWTPKIVQALLVAAGSAAAGGGLAVANSGKAAPAAMQFNSSSGSLGGTPSYSGNISTVGNINANMRSNGVNEASASLGADLAEPSAGVDSSPGVYVVLLSAIPYAAASLYHLLNAWHSQKRNERRWHIAITWLIGAAALILLPAAAGGGLAAAAVAGQGGSSSSSSSALTTVSSTLAFIVLTIAHVGVNGANGIQTGLVSGNIVPSERALGLALYNMIGNVGSFWGPLLIGMLHDATGGYVVAMWVLGGSLAAGALMVLKFKPEQLDRRLS